MSTGEKTIGQRIAALCEAIDKFWRDRDSLDHVSMSTLRTIAAELDMPMDNGDGTVTTFAPVTVTKAIVDDGSRVVAVRPHNPGERFVVVRVILSDPPAPQFREGKYYRTRGGEVVGPLELQSGKEFPFRFPFRCGTATYTKRGTIWSTCTSDGDLLPGEVTVWQPPVSLPKGEYKIDASGMVVSGTHEFLSNHFLRVCYSEWTDPPKPGRYRVPGNGKIATWEGDA